MDAVPMLDRAAIEAALRPFPHSLGLPSEAYTSREVFDWEREHFFHGSWICVGRAGHRKRHPSQVEWHGWAFVNVSGDGVSFEEHIGKLDDDVMVAYAPEDLVVGARHEYEVAANWKLVNENYQECYHCSEIHPELCRVSPPESGRALPHTGLWVSGPMDLREGCETMSLDGRSRGIPLPGLSARQLREIHYVGMWPNFLISPHPDYVLTHRIEPIAPDRSYIECEWLFPAELVGRKGFDASWAVDFWNITNWEDWRACEGVQRGMTSRGHRPGRLSAFWEAGVYMFVTMVARGYLEGQVTRPPEVPAMAIRT